MANPAPTPAPSSKSEDVIRVMLCDDSAFIRSMFGRALGSDATISVVARASNGSDALKQIKANPALVQVLILDIEMPEMDGLTALPLLLQASPGLRVLIASSLSSHGAATTLEALRLGALDYVPKPSAASLSGDLDFQTDLLGKVRALGRPRPPIGTGQDRIIAVRPPSRVRPQLLAIGSSTGGPQALAILLKALMDLLGPSGLEIPAVLTQHMPPSFTPLLADQLTRIGGLPCLEAVDNAPLTRGSVHIAPGGRHLLVNRSPDGLIAKLSDGVAENFCRPSVDPMLRSASAACDGKVLLLMLTGMGRDGLAGTQTLIAAGGTALAQDEASSIVWGMPGAIARAGLCQAVLPLQAMAERAVLLLRGRA